ncbi:MAG TPA: hypothetical protein VLH61_07340 [Bacteroidales bacterium]|nr:hypothetical protein [Bacteroidales bacterium]
MRGCEDERMMMWWISGLVDRWISGSVDQWIGGGPSALLSVLLGLKALLQQSFPDYFSYEEAHRILMLGPMERTY